MYTPEKLIAKKASPTLVAPLRDPQPYGPENARPAGTITGLKAGDYLRAKTPTANPGDVQLIFTPRPDGHLEDRSVPKDSDMKIELPHAGVMYDSLEIRVAHAGGVRIQHIRPARMQRVKEVVTSAGENVYKVAVTVVTLWLGQAILKKAGLRK